MDDGSPDLGLISPDIASSIKMPAGPIRLPKGVHDDVTDNGFGELHIARAARAKQLRDAGHSDVGRFAVDVATGFSEIWSTRDGNRLMLVKRNGKANVAIIELSRSNAGDSYEIVSAGVFRARYPAGGGRKLLWDGERRSRLSDPEAGSLPRGDQSSKK